ncbi:MAG TPA: dipeptidase [Blastocatellia bacterium]|nr:dipeptidase [Blastocatellia bacterium]HMV85442.1 dipeptidase [Blastocatellia bacterium]HMX24652.1 dipeptidase [Blastocatellia bacterium]HMY70573.1 dipeptidase [Blastocatellia bacterium]HMZ18064.1 dipeptidase [Blastocatellia bacterium]
MPTRFSLFFSTALLCAMLALPIVSAQNPAPKPADDTKLRERALKLQRASFVVDTHNDITSPIADEGFDMGARDTSGKIQTDIPRMKEGGLNVEFFSIYVAAKYAKEGGSARRAMEMIDGVYEQVRRHPESLEMAYNVADIRRIRRAGKIAALMGIEGGHAIEDSLSALRLFHRLGVRYMTLTHTNTNNWADSAGGIGNPPEKRHGGLSDFGKEVIREMNRLGMMVDISHVGDETFQDVIETTESPVIASHSSCRALTNVPRNMTDDMLRALAKNGGVIMINFYNGFINTEYAKPGDPMPTKTAEKATLDMLMAHFEHAIKIAGIDHVGIGSDFDGVDGMLPPGMEDVSKLPTITYELLKRGHSEADVKKVLGENLLRVLAENERVAKRLQAAGKRPSTAKINPAMQQK